MGGLTLSFSARCPRHRCIELLVVHRDASCGLQSIWEQYADYFDPKGQCAGEPPGVPGAPIPVTTQLPLGEHGNYDYCFERSNVLISGSRVDWLPSQSHIFLKSHETRVFTNIATKDRFMGSTGYIVPGSEIKQLTQDDQGIVHITLRKPHMSKRNRIYLKLESNSSDLLSVYVDGQLASAACGKSGVE
ncbi:hypothetical protein MBANPS3_002305 [Mucor bainieri]